MRISRACSLFAALTAFTGPAAACQCDDKEIAALFAAPETVIFRATVVSSTLSSQCVPELKTGPVGRTTPEFPIGGDFEQCSVANTLEVHEYLKGRITKSLVVQTQPLFMGVGSCATSLPLGSTFTIVTAYDGVHEIAVDQCTPMFNEHEISRTRVMLKDPDIDQNFREYQEHEVRDYDQVYALADQYKAALAATAKNDDSSNATTLARVRVMLHQKDWTSALRELQSVHWRLESSKDKKLYGDLLAATQALMGRRD